MIISESIGTAIVLLIILLFSIINNNIINIKKNNMSWVNQQKIIVNYDELKNRERRFKDLRVK